MTSNSQVHVPRMKDLASYYYDIIWKTTKSEGNGDLARDPETNSIVNVNSSDYNQYVSRKKLNAKKNQKARTIEEDLTRTKRRNPRN